ncbi:MULTISPECIES: hypothetical protein [Paenibacillus]|jgi:hypothetical protein|uniref:hypothetical protein n=1 Tax=Paenibacillus TaxID=44249 RepID=UPI00073F8C51|nr:MULTISPECIES: hypothetical protein [Paenibacillus]MDU4696774.1 hypothetical protein [Paenibacillus sp.]
MQQIYPLGVDTCKPHIGKTVCAVMRDGRYYIGTITDVNENGIQLNGGYASEANVLSTQPAKAKKQLNQLKSKSKGANKAVTKANAQVQTKAFGYGPGYPGYGYGGGYPGYAYNAYAFDWAAIALLFLIPFLFI